MSMPQFLVTRINEAGRITHIPVKSYETEREVQIIASKVNNSTRAAHLRAIVASEEQLYSLMEYQELVDLAKEECEDMLAHANSIEYDEFLPQHRIIMFLKLANIIDDSLQLQDNIALSDIESEFENLSTQAPLLTAHLGIKKLSPVPQKRPA